MRVHGATVCLAARISTWRAECDSFFSYSYDCDCVNENEIVMLSALCVRVCVKDTCGSATIRTFVRIFADLLIANDSVRVKLCVQNHAKYNETFCTVKSYKHTHTYDTSVFPITNPNNRFLYRLGQSFSLDFI